MAVALLLVGSWGHLSVTERSSFIAPILALVISVAFPLGFDALPIRASEPSTQEGLEDTTVLILFFPTGQFNFQMEDGCEQQYAP